MICAVPVVNADSSEARYTASAAISAVEPTRPIGWRETNQASACAIVWPVDSASAAMRSRSEGDSTVPGQIALQRTPRVTKSAAIDLVMPITAALVAP